MIDVKKMGAKLRKIGRIIAFGLLRTAVDLRIAFSQI